MSLHIAVARIDFGDPTAHDHHRSLSYFSDPIITSLIVRHDYGALARQSAFGHHLLAGLGIQLLDSLIPGQARPVLRASRCRSVAAKGNPLFPDAAAILLARWHGFAIVGGDRHRCQLFSRVI